MRQSRPNMNKSRPNMIQSRQIQGDFFNWFRQKKVLSVEDGKIPTKKVKVGLFNRKMLSFNSDFHFFGRDLPSSTLRTFWGGTSQKNHPVFIWKSFHD